jgi:hypothetical protein
MRGPIAQLRAMSNPMPALEDDLALHFVLYAWQLASLTPLLDAAGYIAMRECRREALREKRAAHQSRFRNKKSEDGEGDEMTPARELRRLY